MSNANPPDDPHAHEPWRRREEVLDRFEATWQGGRPPDIEEYRRPGDRDLLIELVQTDLEYRLKAGEPARVEEYLARYPDLAGPDAVLGLAAAEYELRRRREPDLGPEEYAGRFPEHRDALLALLQAASDTQELEVPGYDVLGELGRGGMGVVYKARQVALNRTVALKMIRSAAHAGPVETARFRREAEAAARLQHANIVQIYEVGSHAGRPYLAMEYVPGGSLAQRLARGPLGPDEAARLVETLARTMHAAHQAGIVHRDLKPANVLLVPPHPPTPSPTKGERGSKSAPAPPSAPKVGEGGWGGEGVVPKVTDFGLAKQMEEEARHSHSGAILGTPAYMAPEQAAGNSAAVGPRTDVYALGAILYEALTGHPPFQAGTSLAILRQVLSDDPVPPASLGPSVPADLQTICLKCLDKDPARRYATALDLADDLARFRAGEPLRARPVGAWERGLKWARRRPASAALLAVSLLALLGLAAGTAAFTAYLHRALEERTAQLRQEQAEHQREQHEHQRQRETALKETQYVLDLRLAGHACKEGRLGECLELLRRHVPAEGEPDPRGFEWRYLWRQCDRGRGDLAGHDERVLCAAFSADGATLATGDLAGKVLLWDVATRRVRSQLLAHTGPVHTLAFTPDGAALASASDEGAVKLWDVAGGRPLATRAAHKPRSLALTPDGRSLAVGASDGSVHLWDLPSLTPRRGPVTFPGVVQSLAFAPDGKTLAAGLYPHTVALLESDTGRSLRTLPSGHGAPEALSFSPDGRTLAVAATVVSLWDVPSGVRLGTLASRADRTVAVGFARDGLSLASGGGDGFVRLWDPGNGLLRARWRAHLGEVSALAFSPGGTLASAGADRVVRLWDPVERPAREPLAVALAPAGPVAHAPDGKTVALAGRDRSVALLDGNGRVRARLVGHHHDLLGLHFGPAGRTLASADEGGLVRVWDVATGRPRLLFSCGRAILRRVAFSRDGGRMASAGTDGAVRLWDLAGTEGAALPEGLPDLEALAFTPDGKTLVTGGLEGTLRSWDAQTGKQRSASTGHGALFAIAFSPDGLLFATGHRDRLVRLWEAATGKPVAVLSRDWPRQCDVRHLAFSPEGRTLVAAGDDGDVDVWDVPARALRHSVRSNGGRARGLSFSPDGTSFALVSGDRGVCFWYPAARAATGQARRPPGQLPRPVRALAFSPDGRTLATGSRYGVIAPFAQPDAAGGWSPAVRLHLGPAVWDHAVPEADDVRLWDVGSRQELPPLPGQKTFGVEGVAFSADGRALVAGGTDGSVRSWDLGARRGGPPRYLTPSARDEWCKWRGALALGVPMRPMWKDGLWQLARGGRDGKLLVTADTRGTVKLWELPDLRERTTLLAGSGKVASVAFSADGATLALAARGEVQLWDAEGVVRQRLAGQRGEVLCLAFSPDGKRLAAGTRQWHVVLWELPEGRPVVMTGHRDSVSSLAFSPDGKTLASGSWDGTVRLWRAASAQELLTLEGHRGKVDCVVFSPDGNTLASGGETTEGGELYLWRAR